MIGKILGSIFTSDKVGSWVRHGLTAAAGALVATGYVSLEHSAELVDALVNILTDERIIGGLVAFAAGKGASSANKKGK